MQLQSLQMLRILGLVEGISYLLLLGVAMPLKYLADMPQAVRIVGSLHGLLFVLFIAALVWVAYLRKWPLLRVAHGFLASLYPFGTFVFDRGLKSEQAEIRAAAGSGLSPQQPKV